MVSIHSMNVSDSMNSFDSMNVFDSMSSMRLVYSFLSIHAIHSFRFE